MLIDPDYNLLNPLSLAIVLAAEVGDDEEEGIQLAPGNTSVKLIEVAVTALTGISTTEWAEQ